MLSSLSLSLLFLLWRKKSLLPSELIRTKGEVKLVVVASELVDEYCLVN
jgi:hypothetical protein